MKQVIATLLVFLLLLCGCKKAPEATTAAPTTTAVPTEPAVTLYDPESYIEENTEGAVRGYPITGHQTVGFRFMGENILLFTMDDNVELTTLLLLKGDELSVAKTVTLDCALYPSDTYLQVGEDSLGYYDPNQNCVVVLDGQLQESGRIAMPDDMMDLPVISSDLRDLYYCSGDEIRVLDLDTGITRMLKQHTCESQSIVGLHFGGKLLEVLVTEEDGRGHVAFVSTETGETLGTDDSLLSLETSSDRYLLRRMDATVEEILVGRMGSSPECLIPTDTGLLTEAFAMNGVLAGSGDTLAFYDLGSGEITSRIRLGEEVTILDAKADPTGRYVWICGYDSVLETEMLYRWDVAATEVVENDLYIYPHYTAESPDTAGLENCRQRAQAIGEKYGIEILVGDALPVPEDYSYEYEYQVEAFEKALSRLDEALGRLPADFLKGLASTSKGGSLTIGLVRGMEDMTGAPVPCGDGLHYMHNGDHHVALTIGSSLEQALYHQLSHVLDAYVYGGSLIYDDWGLLNPNEFAYFGTYRGWEVSEEDPNLQGKTQAFIDGFSMTFAREDRARIFEYAMLSDSGSLFAAPVLQSKLQQMCLAIRDAFGWEKLEEQLPWEQHLTVPET